jgi:hypothetical protein
LKIRSTGWKGFVVAAPLVVGSGVAALWVLPKLVRERVAARVEERTGLSASVEGVSVGFGSVTLDKLCVGQKPDEPSLCARSIAIDAGPLWLALRGSRAVSNVEIEELQVRLPLHRPATQALFARLSARSGKPAGDAASGASAPSLAIKRIGVELSDADGELLSATGGRARVGQQGAELALERMHLGNVAEGAIELERVGLQVVRGAGGLSIDRADVGGARVWLGDQSASAEGPVVGDDADEEDADAQAKKAAPPSAPAPAPKRTTLRRVLSALASLKGGAPAAAATVAAATATAASAASPASTAAAASSASPALLSRLSERAVLTLQGASVYDSANQKPVLERLSATLKMQPGHTLAFAGSGGAQAGGEVRWDLVVTPERSHADGQVVVRALPLSLIAPFLPNVPWYEPEHGRVDAELVIKTDPSQGVVFNGDASLRGAAIASARIAPIPVRGIDVSLRGNGRLLPLQHRLEVDKAELAIRGASCDVHGVVEWSADHYLFDVEATLPPTPCTTAVRAVPEDMLGDMSLAEFQGKLSGHLRVKLDSRDLDKGELELSPVDRCDFVAVPAMADLRRFRVPFLHSVLEPDGTLFEMETGPGTSNWTSLEDISPYFVHAVLAHEDAGFFSHHGFSPRHIRDALVRNLKEKRYVVGASTITMQLVKNVFLHREKTLARKIQEVLLTWWIERVMEKRDILELYLNVIEYGPGVYGIRNGAKHYFNRLPSQLSPAESVFLATILPNPKRYHAYFERGALTPSWTEQMRKMLVRLRERGSYTAEATDYGLHELESFHFYPEGTIVPPRQLPGGAAPLPYLEALADEPGWGEDDEVTEPAPKPAPAPAKPALPPIKGTPVKGTPVAPKTTAPPSKGALPPMKGATTAHAVR